MGFYYHRLEETVEEKFQNKAENIPTLTSLQDNPQHTLGERMR